MNIDVSTRPSQASSSLTFDENQLVSELVGLHSQSRCTTIAQIYETNAPDHSQWIKKHTGVLCFVKDNILKSYFMRMYCLTKHELIWEHELYTNIEMRKIQPYLIIFEGQNRMVALNFAFEEEANKFMNVAVTTIESRKKRMHGRKLSIKKETCIESSSNEGGSVVLRNPVNYRKLKIVEQQKPINKELRIDLLKTKNDEKKKITKADIGVPTNFVHVSHVGWNEGLGQFLKLAGVSENHIKNRQTRSFIENFIENNNVHEIIEEEADRNGASNAQQMENTDSNRMAPPPPKNMSDTGDQNTKNVVVKRIPPPLPVTGPLKNRSTAAMKVQSNSSAPPPPPPLPHSTASSGQFSQPPITEEITKPKVMDSRGALMDSIKKGKALKPVKIASDSVSKSLSTESADSGLKPIDEKSSTQKNTSNSLAKQLNEFLSILDERKAKVGPSSSESENNYSDDEEWSN